MGDPLSFSQIDGSGEPQPRFEILNPLVCVDLPIVPEGVESNHSTPCKSPREFSRDLSGITAPVFNLGALEVDDLVVHEDSLEEPQLQPAEKSPIMTNQLQPKEKTPFMSKIPMSRTPSSVNKAQAKSHTPVSGGGAVGRYSNSQSSSSHVSNASNSVDLTNVSNISSGSAQKAISTANKTFQPRYGGDGKSPVFRIAWYQEGQPQRLPAPPPAPVRQHQLPPTANGRRLSIYMQQAAIETPVPITPVMGPQVVGPATPRTAIRAGDHTSAAAITAPRSTANSSKKAARMRHEAEAGSRNVTPGPTRHLMNGFGTTPNTHGNTPNTIVRNPIHGGTANSSARASPTPFNLVSPVLRPSARKVGTKGTKQTKHGSFAPLHERRASPEEEVSAFGLSGDMSRTSPARQRDPLNAMQCDRCDFDFDLVEQDSPVRKDHRSGKI